MYKRQHPTLPKTTTTTQPDPGSKPGSVNLGDYEQTMLDQHNIHRRNHSAPDLVWDPVSYTHLTLPTILNQCRSRWWAEH